MILQPQLAMYTDASMLMSLLLGATQHHHVTEINPMNMAGAPAASLKRALPIAIPDCW